MLYFYTNKAKGNVCMVIENPFSSDKLQGLVCSISIVYYHCILKMDSILNTNSTYSTPHCLVQQVGSRERGETMSHHCGLMFLHTVKICYCLGLIKCQ